MIDVHTPQAVHVLGPAAAHNPPAKYTWGMCSKQQSRPASHTHASVQRPEVCSILSINSKAEGVTQSGASVRGRCSKHTRLRGCYSTMHEQHPHLSAWQ